MNSIWKMCAYTAELQVCVKQHCQCLPPGSLPAQLPGPAEAAVVAAACVVANVCESYLGATTQGRVPWLSNDVVNMAQILLASLLAAGGCALLP